MKAIILNEFGDTSKLKLVEAPKPSPQEGEVLVRIKAAGVNPSDCRIREGRMQTVLQHRFPIILGWDLAGVVEEVGYAVSRFQEGDEVYAYCRRPVIQYGAYAEYIALPECYLALKPKNIPFEEAASIPLVGVAAFSSLQGKLRAGETALIMGAAGGVGSFAIQLAKLMGAKVIAMTGAENHEYVRGLGADETIDYWAGDFRAALRALAPDRVEVVFDCIGGETIFKALECLKPGGRFITLSGRYTAEHFEELNIDFYNTAALPNAKRLEEVAALFEADKLHTFVHSIIPLENAAVAHQLIDSVHTRGKIVLSID